MEKVLIVIDMQNDFITGNLGSKEAEAIVPAVVKKIREWDGDMIVTLDTHEENYMETLEGHYLPVPHCIRMTDGWEINEEVLGAMSPQYVTIKKPTFGSIELPKLLERNNYKEFHIIGLCTDICVISNALLLRAHYPNSKIVCDARCCAGVTPEKHKAALEVMKSCQIEVINEH